MEMSDVALAESSCSEQGILVSIIVPIYNAAAYLATGLQAIANQTYRPLEVVFFDDASTDDSLAMVNEWATKMYRSLSPIQIVIGRGNVNRGPGFARNESVLLSHGGLICHFDADDDMDATRIAQQVNLYLSLPLLNRDHFLLGCNFTRYPVDSTPYYTDWINNMTEHDLYIQRFRECTIICPSWLYSRTTFNRVAQYRQRTHAGGGADGRRAFAESSPNFLTQEKITRVPEDLYFFLDHLASGGQLAKVSLPLVRYRYSLGSWTLGSKKQDLARVRAKYFERLIIQQKSQIHDGVDWQRGFQVWGYGKDGKKFLKYLSPNTLRLVECFLDVSVQKIGMNYFCQEIRQHIPVRHFSEASDSPIVVLVGSKRTNGELEKNIASVSEIKGRALVEGVDYFHFS